MSTTPIRPLPPNFLYGFATAAYQVEGSHDADGKGPSIWDTFTHTPNKIKNGDVGDIACDSYRLWKEDIALMASYGVNCYRFSVAWSRVIPLGGASDPVNEAGIKFYSNFVDELLRHNITPLVTLYHWDLPQGLHDRYLGWLSASHIVPDFENYARLMYTRLGDRVKHWITFNEPQVVSAQGYSAGTMAPGRSSHTPPGDGCTEPWIAGHSILLAHARAYHLYDREFRATQKGQVAITINCDWCEPFDPTSEADREAAQRRMEFMGGWFADPVFKDGDYPASMRKILGARLPTFTPEESISLKGSSDFFGLNNYTSNLVQDAPVSKADPDDIWGHTTGTQVHKDGSLLGPKSGISWFCVNPPGFRSILKWISERYARPPLYITENGVPMPDEYLMSQAESCNDDFRIAFYSSYLKEMQDAMELDGVDLRGYVSWTLLDNFEWMEGFEPRFGVTWVDRETLKRYPKKSTAFLKKWFEERGVAGGSKRST